MAFGDYTQTYKQRLESLGNDEFVVNARCHGDSLLAAGANGKWSWPVATAVLCTYPLTRIVPTRVDDRDTLTI